mgnify:CR=1 FL=1
MNAPAVVGGTPNPDRRIEVPTRAGGEPPTMQGERDVTVLRLGHRPGRDERMTTHVGLTARALGADRVILTGKAAGAAVTVREVTERFHHFVGGPELFLLNRGSQI